jgi:hypothetical protein
LVGKRIVAGPKIYWNNGKIILEKKVSGRLEMWLPIIYDTWVISIPGVYIGDGKRSYKAKALGLSELLATPSEIIFDDETEGDPAAEDCSACGGSSDGVETTNIEGESVYCYITIYWTLYKSCTGAYVDSGVKYISAKCPEDEYIIPTYNIGYNAIKELPDYIYEVGWEEHELYTGTDEVVIAAAEYKRNCCYNAVHSNCIPQCMTKKSTWYGTTWPLVEKKLKEEYNGKTEIVYVRKSSGVCGTRTDEMVVVDDCCVDDNTYLIVSQIDNELRVYSNGTLEFIGYGDGTEVFDLKIKLYSGKARIVIYNRPSGAPNPASLKAYLLRCNENIRNIDFSIPGPEPSGKVYDETFDID